jgi:hypothetical protein
MRLAVDAAGKDVTAGSSFVFANYDVTETAGTVSAVSLVDASGDAYIAATSTSLSVGLVQLTGAQAAAGGSLVETDTLILNFTGVLTGETGDTIYVDIFTFGDRVNNAIYRFLLEESDDNSAIFEGDVEYIMLNQLNVDEVAELKFICNVSVSTNPVAPTAAIVLSNRSNPEVAENDSDPSSEVPEASTRRTPVAAPVNSVKS